MVCVDVVLHPAPAAIALFEKLITTDDCSISCGDVSSVDLTEFFEETFSFLLDGLFKSIGSVHVLVEIHPGGRMVGRWLCDGKQRER